METSSAHSIPEFSRIQFAAVDYKLNAIIAWTKGPVVNPLDIL